MPLIFGSIFFTYKTLTIDFNASIINSFSVYEELEDQIALLAESISTFSSKADAYFKRYVIYSSVYIVIILIIKYVNLYCTGAK